MKIRVFLLIALFSSPSFAKSYLCVAEAGAGVKSTETGIYADVYDVSNKKYVISNESDSWEFKELGKDASALTCDSEYYCEIKGGFASIFFRSNDGVFTYLFQRALDQAAKSIITYTIKGRCSSL